MYGRCEFCGGKIAEARLNALPYTNTCIDCQRENERHGQTLRPGADDPALGEDRTTSRLDDTDGDSDINLSDFEMDLSESGR